MSENKKDKGKLFLSVELIIVYVVTMVILLVGATYFFDLDSDEEISVNGTGASTAVTETVETMVGGFTTFEETVATIEEETVSTTSKTIQSSTENGINTEQEETTGIGETTATDRENYPPVIPSTVFLGEQHKIPEGTVNLSTEDINFTPGIFKVEEHYPNVIMPLSERAGDDYASQLVLVGDSTTYGHEVYGTLPEGTDTINVWVPESKTLMLTSANIEYGNVYIYNKFSGAYEHMLIKDAVELYQPKYLIITLGINGVSYVVNNVEFYIGEYVKLINSIIDVSPYTNIMVNSVYPVAKTYTTANPTNERINMANFLFARMCEAMGVPFLNSASVLMGEDGYMKEEYHAGDGLHMGKPALDLIIEYFRTHAHPSYVPGEYVSEPVIVQTTAVETSAETTIETTETTSSETLESSEEAETTETIEATESSEASVEESSDTSEETSVE